MKYITSVIVGVVVLLHYQCLVIGNVGIYHSPAINASQRPSKTNSDSGNLTKSDSGNSTKSDSGNSTTESSYSSDIQSTTTDPENSTDLSQFSNETDSDSGNLTDLYTESSSSQDIVTDPLLTEANSSQDIVTNPPLTEVNAGCVNMTYNSTKLIYKYPGSSYNIWFMALKEGASIEMKFDFSVNGKFSNDSVVRGPAFKYNVIPMQWDMIEIETGKHVERDCKSWAQLKIPKSNEKACLPHHTISCFQVASNSLVIWSTCKPQGQWWGDTNKPSSEQNASSGSIIALAVCFGFTLLFLALLGTYICHHRINADDHKSKRIPQAEGESDYAEWEDIRSQVQLTPPSSASYTSTSNGTMKTLLTT